MFPICSVQAGMVYWYDLGGNKKEFGGFFISFLSELYTGGGGAELFKAQYTLRL
jgi:hypothetical protein